MSRDETTPCGGVRFPFCEDVRLADPRNARPRALCPASFISRFLPCVQAGRSFFVVFLRSPLRMAGPPLCRHQARIRQELETAEAETTVHFAAPASHAAPSNKPRPSLRANGAPTNRPRLPDCSANPELPSPTSGDGTRASQAA